ncbi:SMY2 [Candida margitis]|uniref:SMY2 n=1 Tax=Candida margitis TaxID=1775924 RepID=UPI002227ABEC|nr:SMY2 [Candida margitis]KAI5970335.1 SMY2 [Candida margitis]
MFSRSRRTLDHSANENFDDSTSSYAGSNSNSNSGKHHFNGYNNNSFNAHSNSNYHNHYGNGSSIKNVQENKNGKPYSMDEVFQVWYDNQDKIMNSEVKTDGNENYKVSKPELIYHLTLQEQYQKNNPNSGVQSQGDARQENLVSQDGKEGNFSTKGNAERFSGDNISESLNKLNLSDEKTGQIPLSTNPLSFERTPSFHGSFGNSNSVSSTFSTELPPGLSQPKALVSSDKLEWLYIDPSGNEQGPFNGDMMQEWFTGGYLDLDLRIRRKEEQEFKTLKSLCDAVQNYIQPFKVPLPDLTKKEQDFGLGNRQSLHNSIRLPSSTLPQSMFAGDFINSPANETFSANLNSPMTNLSNINTGFPSGPGFTGIDNFNPSAATSATHDSFDQNFNLPSMPSLLQQQIQHQQKPLLSRNNSNWAVDTGSPLVGQVSGPASATGSSAGNFIGGLNNHGAIGNPQMSQPAPVSPWISSANLGQSVSRINSPFTPGASTNHNVGGYPDVRHDSLSGKEEDANESLVMNSVVTDILQDDNEPAGTSFAETKEEVTPTPPKKTAGEIKKKDEPEVKVAEAEEEITVPPTRTVDLKPAKPQALAPWASKTKTDDAKQPNLSLKEIQKVESEKSEQQKKLQSKLKAEQAQKAWAANAASEKAAAIEQENKKTQLPPTWGAASDSTPVVKSLAEIQKEEAELAKAKAKAAAVAAATATAHAQSAPLSASTSTGTSFSPNLSFANALAHAVPKEETTAWTTVASAKKTPLKTATVSSTSTGVPASKLTPQLLRNVSAAKTSTSSVNLQAVREDFLVWARSQMTNLYPSVSKNDLLEMFITLPHNSPDTQQLISETIYASSTTMDGRRFAQEFAKRKGKVEQTLGREAAKDYTSWSSAIISSADKVQTVDEDGWSTSVKTKKKSGSRK